MRQCKKCKVYFEELISSSFTCNKCMSRRETDAHPTENTISNDENEQITVQSGMTKETGIDIKPVSLPSLALLKTNVSNPNASLESVKLDSLNFTRIDDSPCNPRNESEILEPVQGYDFFKTQLNVTDQLLLRNSFENVILNQFLPDQAPDLEHNVSSRVDTINEVPDISTDISPSDGLSFSNQSSSSSSSDLASISSSKLQKRKKISRCILKNKRNKFRRTVYPRTRLSPIPEEIGSDNDSIKAVASNSSREQSPNPDLETSSVGKPMSTTDDENDSDDDYIDDFNPKLPSGSKVFKCTQCLLRFNSEIDLLSHVMSHELLPPSQFKCNYKDCNKSFTSDSQLVAHLNAHFSNSIYGRVSKYFRENDHLKRKSLDFDNGSVHESPNKKHCKVPVKNPDIENFRSDLTGGSSSTESPSGNKPYTCSYTDCQQNFSTHLELASHLGSHFGPPYMCNFCTRLFPTLEIYYQHQEVHYRELNS